ncbi:MaoC family dehydratase [Lichenicoccus sp.]|uniref:MaoC family dehydratase n=1 Tax=Lichenicoccus sp. TaxID=2781899 RepID=UPI003D108331
MTRLITQSELPSLVGQELGVSRWFAVEQPRIDGFAKLTEDEQWIHVDVARATREAGGTIAHGLLTLSLLPAMGAAVWRLEGTTSVLNYGFDRVRFTAAVPSGSRVRLCQTLLKLEERSSGLLITQRGTVEVEGGERPALVADSLGLFRFG